ncbi:hypothetical protein RAS1_26290 [Phycisphaerae bacterium RAS1]|nr:hypothetical protein RAS1_26290 [Phycisphaerae bacterium RAS1]
MLLRQKDRDTVDLSLSLSQLKKLYVALFRQLHDAGPAGFDDLDEDDMLLTLQTYLQRRAGEQGVDCTIHRDWEAFLGVNDAPSCEQRFAARNGGDARPADAGQDA